MVEPFYKVTVSHCKSQNSFRICVATDNQKLAMEGYKNFHQMHSDVVILNLNNIFDKKYISKQNLPERALIMSMDNLSFDIKDGRWRYKMHCYGTFSRLSTIEMIEQHYHDLYAGVNKDD